MKVFWSLLFSVLFNAETQGYLGCTEKVSVLKGTLVVANMQCDRIGWIYLEHCKLKCMITLLFQILDWHGL